MQSETILEGLREMLASIRPSLDTASLGLESRLTEDIGLDSITILMLSFAIESRYNIHFDTMPQFVTVGDVVAYIQQKLS